MTSCIQYGGYDIISRSKVLCCHIASENEASAWHICSSARQFLIYSTFLLVCTCLVAKKCPKHQKLLQTDRCRFSSSWKNYEGDVRQVL